MHPATINGLSSLLFAYVIDADISNLKATAEANEHFPWKVRSASKPS